MVAFSTNQAQAARACNKPLPFKNILVGSGSKNVNAYQLPIISEYAKGKTVYVIKSMVDHVIYDCVFDMSVKKFMVCYANWVNGMVIQKAFPMLDAGMREFIKTGITPEQWDTLFKETAMETAMSEAIIERP
jgi:hypothetical protein